MGYWWKSEDPEAREEEGKYNNPAPSRTFILRYLNKRAIPLHYGQLCSAFTLDEPGQLEALRRRLIAMCRDGQLVQNRKQAFCLPDKMQLVSGRVHGHRDGFGFLTPDDGSSDFFLTPKQMESLFDGDKIMVRETEVDSRGRRWCITTEVLERAFTQVVGVYHKQDGIALVEPDNHRLPHEIIVLPGGLVPTEGQYVVVEIKEYPSRRKAATGLIKEVIGFGHESGVEVEIAMRNHNIPCKWPEDAQKLASSFSFEVAEEDKLARIDLRHLPLVTIDGEDARDFDDAVYAERKKSGGWRLYVAIADVSHYVKPGDALDLEAQNRGNSVYFPYQVIPMLPEILSNGLCSLNPHVDRLALVCEMTISKHGKLSGYTFYESVIQSHARLTYTQVSAMLESPDSEEGKKWCQQFSTLEPCLKELYSLYKGLQKVREARGAIDFDTVETRIIFDKQHKIQAIVPTRRNEAHKLIEECMLCANQATAKFFDKHGLTSLFRVHKGPTEQKLENLYTFLGEMGLSLPSKDKPSPGDYQHLLTGIQDRPDVSIVQTMLLRSLSQAEYHPENTGHFGLAYKAYAHFTSPIRRYPDLLAHRAIRHIICSDASSSHVRRAKGTILLEKQTIYPYESKEMLALGIQCSATERRADEAVRDVITSLKCQYIKQHLGEVYHGKVGAVTGFGLFVDLDNIYISGLIHISSLPDDYYHFDQARQRLVGEHSRRVYALGDDLNVCVVKVSVEEKKIDFELEETAGKKKKNTGASQHFRKKKNRRQKVEKTKKCDIAAIENGESKKRSGAKKKKRLQELSPAPSSKEEMIAMAKADVESASKKKGKKKHSAPAKPKRTVRPKKTARKKKPASKK